MLRKFVSIFEALTWLLKYRLLQATSRRETFKLRTVNFFIPELNMSKKCVPAKDLENQYFRLILFKVISSTYVENRLVLCFPRKQAEN